MNNLIARASEQARASDIHIEPAELRARAAQHRRRAGRYRAASGADEAAAGLAHQGHGLARHRRAPPAAAGQPSAHVRGPVGHEIDLRIATSPTIHGESVVMRILDKRSSLSLDFKTLGFEDDVLELFLRAIRQPHGITSPGHRPDRQRQDDHALRLAGRDQPASTARSSPSRTQSNTASPVSTRRRSSLQIDLTFCRRSCARSCARTRTSMIGRRNPRRSRRPRSQIQVGADRPPRSFQRSIPTTPGVLSMNVCSTCVWSRS